MPAGSLELSWTVFDEPVDAAVGDVLEDPEAQAARTSNMATEASLRHVAMRRPAVGCASFCWHLRLTATEQQWQTG